MTSVDDRPAGPGGPPLQTVLDAVSGKPLLADQTIIVTGAAGGIGRVLALVLAAAGARLAITDLDSAGLASVAGELRTSGTSLVHDVLNVSDASTFGAFHGSVTGSLGPVDGLVNCAGSWTASPYDEIDPGEWARMLAANLGSAFAACQAVLPAMVERRQGSVVNFASTAGEYGSVSPAAHYAAAKGGVIALTKTLAREVSPYGVRVNAVSPGPTDTPSLIGNATPAQRRSVGSRTLLGRLGQPHEIAAACVFLLGPLSTFVTGHVLGVNGGSLLKG